MIVNFIKTNSKNFFNCLEGINKADHTVVSSSQSICLLIDSNLELTTSILQLDQQCGGIISKFLQQNKKDSEQKCMFSGKFGEVKLLTVVKDDEVKNIVLLGTGKSNQLKEFQVQELGGVIQKSISTNSIISMLVLADCDINNYDRFKIASLIASGAELASYKFKKYLTKNNDDNESQKTSPINLFIGLEDVKDVEQAQAYFNNVLRPINEGVILARDLISEPPNKLYPAIYAEKIEEEFKTLRDRLGIELKVEILGVQEMQELSMGALLGVGQGSRKESKLVSISYLGAINKDQPPLALVGKGVTFDTGGISLKPSAGMEDMKYDMAGSAAVIGAIKALACRKAQINVVGIVALVENMPGGNAQRPSDVVTTMSGKTVEVLNTDAEGRLILADALWYAQEAFKPEAIIDLATLTGAIIIAVGYSYAGCFSNNDELAQKLINSGEKVNENLWRMPLHKDYDDMLKSSIADIANIGNARGAAGSSTAASFLQKFIQFRNNNNGSKNPIPWIHLDIASVAWNKKGGNICPPGAAGFGVRLINQFVKDNYEQS
ncbi:cytosol aminopeptidase family, catalytic domain protein [Orientia chuto str. Dubai]|uniref:Probable cytosol aminopeptidase n=1 Tax=Orientia chuto str. Dubai TaxID=1359168 RepID=A0A0F3MRN4_9RICK|nr:leucyl aminopeptidase [Candidatus Orientia mediorientalis]KJV57259.1 cytosol aminopeptidase family, catalytic domain protein [Orientia chuto str. Dubai]